MRTTSAALVALLLVGGPAFAQEDRPRSDRSDRHGPPQEHVFKMVDAYFIANLKERLALSDDQLARLVPHVTRHHRDRRTLVQRRMRAMIEMRRLLMSGTATEAAVQDLLREVKAVEAEEPVTLRRDMDAIDALLTPVQQAKYRLLEAEVERRVRHAMARARPQRGRGREAPPPEREPR